MRWHQKGFSCIVLIISWYIVRDYRKLIFSASSLLMFPVSQSWILTEYQFDSWFLFEAVFTSANVLTAQFIFKMHVAVEFKNVVLNLHLQIICHCEQSSWTKQVFQIKFSFITKCAKVINPLSYVYWVLT